MLAAIVTNFIKLLFFPLRAFRRRYAAPKRSYITVKLDGHHLLEVDTTRRRLWNFGSARRRVLSVERLRKLSREVSADPRVLGVVVVVSSYQGGFGTLSSVREVLLELRANRKRVIVYIENTATTNDLFLASAADHLCIAPETTVMPIGFAIQSHYLKRALDNVGLEPEVFAKGTYKSAGETLTRDSMSEPQREQLSALLDARYDAFAKALATGRGVTVTKAQEWIERAPFRAEEALQEGMVDAVFYDYELNDYCLRIAESNEGHGPSESATGPLGEPFTGPPLVPFERYERRRRPAQLRPLAARPCIGIVEVRGAIVQRARATWPTMAVETRIRTALRLARRSPNVGAVIVVIDSPGGSAVASDRIYRELMRLAADKPVIAYLSNVAASGGYYIASAAHRIIAPPEVITGSIGVVATRFVFAPLLERLGVSVETVKRGKHADYPSMARHLDADERERFGQELEAFYRTFLGVVARGRGRTAEEIEPLAGGRVYGGIAAKACGLIDHLGGFDRAILEARELLKTNDAEPRLRVIHPPRERSKWSPLSLSSGLFGPSGSFVDELVERALVTAHFGAESVLAYCPAAQTRSSW